MNNIPDFLIELLIKQYGEEQADEIIKGYSKGRKTTIRVNTLKSTVEEIKKTLTEKKITYKEVLWSKEALIIDNVTEKEIKDLEIYDNGKIYLQSLSSMLPPIILNPKENLDILDMAAAPGGKTTQIAALTNNKAHITACEMNKIRAEKLKYNIEKQGATSVYILETDSRRLNNYFSFDQILLDSPCSGSGTLDGSNPNVSKFFTERLIDKCTKTQFELLKKAIDVLKPGKEMVYSTCSILSRENEDIINKILREKNLEIVPIKLEGQEELPILKTSIEGTLCIAPNELYEGFFIAKLRKKS